MVVLVDSIAEVIDIIVVTEHRVGAMVQSPFSPMMIEQVNCGWRSPDLRIRSSVDRKSYSLTSVIPTKESFR